MKKTALAFTLVELLVVIAILGVLATIGLIAFNTSLVKGRDAQRKSDLNALSHSLELFNEDYNRFPMSDAGGNIYACPFNSSTKTGSICSWGSSEMKDTDSAGNTKTSYLKILPKDPTKTQKYFYRVDSADPNNPPQRFQLFAHLENAQDQNCLPGADGAPNCATPANIPNGVTCGNTICNFMIASPNTGISDF